MDTKHIEILRPMWDQRKQMYKIVKKTYNGSGGWARFGGKFYAVKHECEEVISSLVSKFPDQYAEE